MRVTLRRSVAVAGGSLGALAVAAVVTLGCSASPAQRARAAPSPAHSQRAAAAAPAPPACPPKEAQEDDATVQREAQESWCNYLSALYLRADETATAWPRFGECVAVQSTASPTLLKLTADCSLRALDAFEGSPFTAAYAAQVSRCGNAAIDATTAQEADLEPFFAALCRRVVACGKQGEDECRASFDYDTTVGLARAVGAMNGSGRKELRACLGATTCEQVKDRLSNCLDPIMDRLLWLPD